MNMFMHGIEEFSIVRGDTLANPSFLYNDELKKFNVILANPPYSIKQWDDKSFENDPFGRNFGESTTARLCRLCFSATYTSKFNMQLMDVQFPLWPWYFFRDMEKTMREI